MRGISQKDADASQSLFLVIAGTEIYIFIACLTHTWISNTLLIINL